MDIKKVVLNALKMVFGGKPRNTGKVDWYVIVRNILWMLAILAVVILIARLLMNNLSVI